MWDFGCDDGGVGDGFLCEFFGFGCGEIWVKGFCVYGFLSGD